MKNFKIILALLLLTGFSGCSIESTGKLKEQICMVKDEISEFERLIIQLESLDDDIVKLGKKRRELKAEWETIMRKYPDKIKQLRKQDGKH